MTVCIFLSDNFRGGETRFYKQTPEQLHLNEQLTQLTPSACVVPEVGKALIFYHGASAKSALHSSSSVSSNDGAAVESVKYVLQTDVMYTVPWTQSRPPPLPVSAIGLQSACGGSSTEKKQRREDRAVVFADRLRKKRAAGDMRGEDSGRGPSARF
jgi:hypothetical protein